MIDCLSYFKGEFIDRLFVGLLLQPLGQGLLIDGTRQNPVHTMVKA